MSRVASIDSTPSESIVRLDFPQHCSLLPSPSSLASSAHSAPRPTKACCGWCRHHLTATVTVAPALTPPRTPTATSTVSRGVRRVRCDCTSSRPTTTIPLATRTHPRGRGAQPRAGVLHRVRRAAGEVPVQAVVRRADEGPAPRACDGQVSGLSLPDPQPQRRSDLPPGLSGYAHEAPGTTDCAAEQSAAAEHTIR